MTFFHCFVGFVLLLVFGCSDAAPVGAGGGAGGSGAGGDGHTGGVEWGYLTGPECPCTPVPDSTGGDALTATLDCFCQQYICDPESDQIEVEPIVEEYPDCDRRVLIYDALETATTLMFDTATGQLVGAGYVDDSGVCWDGGVAVSAGEFPPCMLGGACEGPCEGTGSAHAAQHPGAE